MGREERGGRRNRDRSKENRNIPKLIEETNWRLEQEILARERERNSHNTSNKQAGILVLPQPIKKETSPKSITTNNTSPSSYSKKLYDPSNPIKFIPVSPNNRTTKEDDSKGFLNVYYPEVPTLLSTNVAEQLTSKPVWYNPYTEK